MRVSSLSPWAWVALLAGSWLAAGFVFAAMGTQPTPGIDDIARRALAPGDHRLLIVGGSNAVSGIDAGLLSRQLNQPVVNLSLTAEGGDERVLWHFADATAKPGDTVLLSLLSFITDYGKVADDPASARANDDAFARLMPGRYRRVGIRVPHWRALPARPFAVIVVDALGSHPAGPPPQFECTNTQGVPGEMDSKPLNAAYWRSVRENIAALQRKHVTVLATLPWLYIKPQHHHRLRQRLADATTRLRAMNVVVIDPDIEAAVRLDGNLFCDVRHLNPHGAAVHTDYIADNLQRLQLTQQLQ